MLLRGFAGSEIKKTHVRTVRKEIRIDLYQETNYIVPYGDAVL